MLDKLQAIEGISVSCPGEAEYLFQLYSNFQIVLTKLVVNTARLHCWFIAVLADGEDL